MEALIIAMVTMGTSAFMAKPEVAEFSFGNVFGLVDHQPIAQTNRLWDIALFIVNQTKMTVYELCITNMMLTINALVMIIIMYGVIRIIRGRHRTRSENAETTNNCNPTATLIHLNNTLQCRACTPNSHSNTKNVEIPRTKPSDYTGKSDLATWLMKLELYLETWPRDVWVNIAIQCIQEDCLKHIVDLDKLRKEEDGYEKFKNAMLMKGERKPKDVQLRDLTLRTQNENESILKYGQDIVKLAKQLFANIQLSDVDKQLKETFVQGIRDEEMRIVAFNKLYAWQSQQATCDIHQLIEHMDNE